MAVNSTTRDFCDLMQNKTIIRWMISLKAVKLVTSGCWPLRWADRTRPIFTSPMPDYYVQTLRTSSNNSITITITHSNDASGEPSHDHRQFASIIWRSLFTHVFEIHERRDIKIQARYLLEVQVFALISYSCILQDCHLSGTLCIMCNCKFIK